VILCVAVTVERKSEFVMPVQTGIHLRPRFAGIALDSGLRRNDGIKSRPPIGKFITHCCEAAGAN